MSNSKIKKIRYFTKEKLALISEENKTKYNRYLTSCKIKNKKTSNTTYKMYENYMNQFLVFLAEKYDNANLYGEFLKENMVDVLEDYIVFLQDTLNNNSKVINTKLATISSFYHFSAKRKYIDFHFFDKKLDRIKNSQNEKIIEPCFLTQEQVDKIKLELQNDSRFDMQDILLFNIFYDSCNRLSAVQGLTLDNLRLDNNIFVNVQEKRSKEVELFFMDSTKKYIEKWLEMRKEGYDNLSCSSLFISKYRNQWNRMNKNTIQKRIQKIGKLILGLDNFHCHSIRKTKADLTYKATNDIALVQEMCNHESAETSIKFYTQKPSKTILKDRLQKLQEQLEKEQQNQTNTPNQ